ncbi:FbpB family small basic protein [Paenalkalicoccus suaedae]|uniref:FbpB family small basic protein n=1 Tax=Paenalkalicoccus suaedae TaxID=2592382 RepID=A0A859FEC2_9BACI|nr:FbpB family small basic protein [Paenalkalicoccus suaedae]QKS70575.1 FbpB family small basic protein [Paenalkalicoccus suaedae]
MRKANRKSFEELVQQNKQEILADPQAIDQIEEKLEERHEQHSAN